MHSPLLAYVGPETVVPFLSILAAIAGFLIAVGHRIWAGMKQVAQFFLGRSHRGH